MKPLILHIRASNFFGGPERQITGHIAVSNQRFRHLIVTFVENGQRNQLYDYCKDNDIPVTAISTRHSFEFSSMWKLRKIFKSENPSVVCSHGYKPTIMTLLARIGLKIPLLAFARGHTGENLKVKIYEFLEFKALLFADLAVAVSAGYAEYLCDRGIPKKRIRVVKNAINVDKFIPFRARCEEKREELGFFKDECLIATAGRLSPEKAQRDLILAFDDLRKRFNHVRLLLCGDGPLRQELESLVRDNKIPNVYFLGFRKDLDEIIPAIDLFVLPSLTEGLPNVLLEACACAKPLVATNVGGIPEVITPDWNGFLVAPHRTDLLFEAMERMLVGSTGQMLAMGKNGLELMRGKFTFEAQARDLEALYACVGGQGENG